MAIMSLIREYHLVFAMVAPCVSALRTLSITSVILTGMFQTSDDETSQKDTDSQSSAPQNEDDVIYPGHYNAYKD